MFKLPNGKPIDSTMVEAAMEDASLEHAYYLNVQTSEVAFLSEWDVTPESEKQQEDIESSNCYVPIECIPSHEAYQWMEDFVAEIVAPKDAQAAEKLSIALMGKGAFRRFKDVFYRIGDEWVQAWYRWRDDCLKQAMREWFASLPVTITEISEERSP